MVTAKAFKVGKTAYWVRFYTSGKSEISECVISKVGRKYVRINESTFGNVFYNRSGDDDYLSEDRADGVKSRLYPTMKTASDGIEMVSLRRDIYKRLQSYTVLETRTLQQLQSIYKNLMEDNKTE